MYILYEDNIMKLSDWAKKNGLNYQTAYRWYKAGKLPASAYQADTGTIIITDNKNLNKEENNAMRMSKYYSNSPIRREFDQLYNIFNSYPFSGAGLFDQVYAKDSQKFKWFNKSDRYVLGCILPGYNESDVKINIKGDILSISAKIENVDEDNLFYLDHQSEFNYSWTLPSDADFSSITANFKNGILYLTVPKLKAKQKEEIQIPINKK